MFVVFLIFGIVLDILSSHIQIRFDADNVFVIINNPQSLSLYNPFQYPAYLWRRTLYEDCNAEYSCADPDEKDGCQ